MTLISITPSDLVNTLARGDIDDFSWSLKAVEAVDRNIGKIIDAADKADYSYMIVSDHGNCEEMRD
ncbi:MAG: alkaline phosphatase family protein, partial [Helicobacteraceae bacterium]|nr:alkaline phosphatase family protein [Helicobacteraceae bacterium]